MYDDIYFVRAAMELALISEAEGNLPIGSVITLDDIIISRGRNKIFAPDFHPLAHAEIDCIRNLDKLDLEHKSKSMTLYTNIEPCVMCMGAIIIHRIGKVVFGAYDINRGASFLKDHLSKIYTEDRLPKIVGPVLQDECSQMFKRADDIYRRRRDAPNS